MKISSLLKKSTHLASTALLLVSTLLPTLSLMPAQKVAAATTGVGTLTPGTSWDTGNHTYSSQLGSATNYTVKGNDSPSTSGQWFNLINNHQGKIGVAAFNGALDATKTFQLQATIKLESTASLFADWNKTGASLGFVLSPASVNTLANNGYGSSYGLGIQGIANSVFAGRDLYSDLTYTDPSSGNISNTWVDGNQGENGWGNGPGEMVVIRKTGADTNLQQADYPNIGSYNGGNNLTNKGDQEGQAWALAQDQPYVAGIGSGHGGTAQEPVTLSWTPDATNSATTAGYQSGTLKFTLVAQNQKDSLTGNAINQGKNGYTVSAKQNIPLNLTIGFVATSGNNIVGGGSTNTNTGNLSVSLNGTQQSAYRGTEPVTVNYINSVTGKKIAADPSSTITANIYDRVAIVAPGGTATSTNTSGIQGTYTYVAPAAPAGYTYTSKVTYGGTFDSSGKLQNDKATDPNDSTNTVNANGMTVANYDSTAANATSPNVVNIYYTPLTQSGTVSYTYMSDVPGFNGNAGTAAVLPSTAKFSGLTDDSVTVPQATIPAGYTVDHVVAPDTKSYTPADGTLATAISMAQTASATNQYYNTTSNDWKVYLEATKQTPTLSAHFSAAGVAGSLVPKQEIVNFQDDKGNTFTAATGAPIPTADIAPTIAALNQSLSADTNYNPDNWTLKHYTDPLGNPGTDLSALVTSSTGVNGLVLGSSNDYVAQYDFVGTIAFSVPDEVDFGTHDVTGVTQNLTGKMVNLSGDPSDPTETPTAVIVSDNRKQPTTGSNSWSLSVEQSTPITDSTNTGSYEQLPQGGDNLFKPIWQSNGNSWNLANDLYYTDSNGKQTQMTTGSSIQIGTQTATTTGQTTTVLGSNSKAFTLSVPANMQTPKAHYHGQLTWTLTYAP